MAKKTTNNTESIQTIIDTEAEKTNINLKDTSRDNPAIHDNVYIKVKSNVIGELIYVNVRDGEEFRWHRAGEVLSMPMGALRAMRTSQVNFFRNQWVIILGVDTSMNSECTAKPADIYKALGIVSHYQNIVEPADYEAIISWKPDEVEQRIALMTQSGKDNLAVAIKAYVDNGMLYDLRLIRAFSAALGLDLA